MAFNPNEPRDSAGRWTRVSVPARSVVVGDRLDPAGKKRVTKTHPRNGRILLATQLKGARSGSIQSHKEDDMVDVYRQALDLANFDPHELRDHRGRWTKSAVLAGMHEVTNRLRAEVSVDGGPDRDLMPQLSGAPLPGSRADKMYPNRPAGTEVDLTSLFQDWLIKRGTPVIDTEVDVLQLKPTQDQLVGPKVLGIAKFMDTAPADSPVFEPIFVTKDDFVVDGHHRWAAEVVLDEVEHKPRKMKVRQIQADKPTALALATKFMDYYGLPRAGMNDKTTVSKMVNLSSTTYRLVDLSMGDTRPLARPGYKGGRKLSDAERGLAHALMRKGTPKHKAIRMARGLLKKAARSGRWGDHGVASKRTRAKAALSIAQRKTF